MRARRYHHYDGTKCVLSEDVWRVWYVPPTYPDQELRKPCQFCNRYLDRSGERGRFDRLFVRLRWLTLLQWKYPWFAWFLGGMAISQILIPWHNEADAIAGIIGLLVLALIVDYMIWESRRFGVPIKS